MILVREVNITSANAITQFQYTLEGNADLRFYISGNLMSHFTDPTSKSTSPAFELGLGFHVLKWKYEHIDQHDYACIHNIAVTGSEEGGGAFCRECAPGHVSEARSKKCMACLPGEGSNPTKSKCEICPNSTYSDTQGTPCILCPNNTLTTENRTACVGKEHILLDGSSYRIENLTGVRNGQTGYTDGMCNRENKFHYCYGAFYGPIPSNYGTFWASVLNPDVINLPLDIYSGKLERGYFFGYVNSTFLASSDSEDMEMEDSDHTPCPSKGALANLGSRIDSITPLTPDSDSSSGFVVNYTHGDLCYLNKPFSSSITFICDKDEGDGWPTFSYLSLVECHVSLEWKTRFACAICTSGDMGVLESDCESGQRYVYLVEGRECLLPNDTIFWSSDCSLVRELASSWPFIIGAGIFGVLLIVIVAFLVCFLKQRNKYVMLKEFSGELESGRSGEGEVG